MRFTSSRCVLGLVALAALCALNAACPPSPPPRPQPAGDTPNVASDTAVVAPTPPGAAPPTSKPPGTDPAATVGPAVDAGLPEIVLEDAEADRLLGEQRKLFVECDRLDAWIIVKLWVASDGKATHADVVTASGKHPRIWNCAVAPLEKLAVSPPSSGRATVYEFRMRFRGVEKLR